MTPKHIGATLRAARKTLGWTWNRAATESGLKPDQVKGIEEGSKAYTVQSLIALSKALDHELAVRAKGSGAHSTKGANGSDDVQG